jgi:hypothetical protein
VALAARVRSGPDLRAVEGRRPPGRRQRPGRHDGVVRRPGLMAPPGTGTRPPLTAVPSSLTRPRGNPTGRSATPERPGTVSLATCDHGHNHVTDPSRAPSPPTRYG